jgi:bifunctional non-homologous end joining protein LigD
MASATLGTYQRKRDFRGTPEPRGAVGKSTGRALRFVVQKHAARRLHYDFRLEMEGVLRSWAVPKGPSLDPAVKRMAVETEDHPIAYGDFEGEIPAGHYGAGSVLLWDSGQWKPEGDPVRGYRQGKLKFTLQGHKLKGGYTLVRMKGGDQERSRPWLLIKERDEQARNTAEYDVLAEAPDSVIASRRASHRVAPMAGTGKARGKAIGSKARAAAKACARLPAILAPELATLVDAPPEAGDWAYELKFDGYRLLVRVSGGKVQCFTRNGHDWSRRLPELVRALGALKLEGCWLDGEIVMLDGHGAPDFQALQNAFDSGRTAQIRYFVFDAPFVQGEDLRDLPLAQRRERLEQLLDGRTGGPVQLSATLSGNPSRLLEASRAAGFEGLIGKRTDSSYVSGRSRDWIKLKTGLRQEFVIGGYTDPQGSRSGFGSLLLGVHDEEGKLRYVGNVGSGFDESTLARVKGRLDAVAAQESAFDDPPRRVGPQRKLPHWVKPKLVAEVSFAGWTREGHLRQAVFRGLRADKPPRAITRERPVHSPEEKDMKLPRNLRITNPDRVIDSGSGATKGDLVAYYARVAKLMLPHLKDRPVALLRAPDGVAGEQFFQKHAQARSMPELARLDRRLDPGHGALLVVPDVAGLLSAAQMNTVELHTWNATSKAIEQPDRMVFDLDPGEGVEWPAIREAALLVRTLLQELGFVPFLKTSGGKGLHVVVPLRPGEGWDEVKGFSQQIVQHLARVIPQRFVAKSGPKNRVGKIFVDYLRNGRGATTVAAWSARAREGMGISVPIEWDELEGMKSASPWSILDFEPRLAAGNAPWKAYGRSRRTLGAARKRLAAAMQVI